MQNIILSAVVLLGHAACAGGPPSTAASGPVPEGHVQITVARTDDALFLGAPAAVTANGQPAGSFWRGEKLSTFAPAGRTTLTASPWSHPDSSRLAFNAELSRDYSLAVAPRGSAFFGSMFMPLMLVDAVSEDGGAFALRPSPQ